MLSIRCRRIVGGTGKGKAIITKQPINFLAMLNKKNGTIVDQNHELFGKCIKDIVLIFPYAIGSSVGAYTIYSLKVNQVAPIAMVCSNKADLITASGCAISNIPLVDMLEKPVPSLTNSEIDDIIVDADKELVALI
jgi:predicted aconitase with swiveling domain